MIKKDTFLGVFLLKWNEKCSKKHQKSCNKKKKKWDTYLTEFFQSKSNECEIYSQVKYTLVFSILKVIIAYARINWTWCIRIDHFWYLKMFKLISIASRWYQKCSRRILKQNYESVSLSLLSFDCSRIVPAQLIRKRSCLSHFT